MFTHLLQIASFKSKPQNFESPVWAILLLATMFVGVQGYALSLSPGNELIRMFVASSIKLVVVAGILYVWIRSVDAGSYFKSTLVVIIFASLLTEIVKLPLSTMIRQTEQDADVVMAILYSLPLWGVIVWQYWVWFYAMKESSERSKTEVITMMITLILISEVAGSVLSKIGGPVEGFS